MTENTRTSNPVETEEADDHTGPTTCQFHKWNCQVFINIKIREQCNLLLVPKQITAAFSIDLKVKSPCRVKNSGETHKGKCKGNPECALNFCDLGN